MGKYVNYTTELIESAPPYVREEDIIDVGCIEGSINELNDCQTNINDTINFLDDAYKASSLETLNVNGANPFGNLIDEVIGNLAFSKSAVSKLSTGLASLVDNMQTFDKENYNLSKTWIDDYKTAYDNEIAANKAELASRLNSLKDNDGNKIYSYSKTSSLETMMKTANNWKSVSNPTLPKEIDEAIKLMPNYNDCISGKYGITYCIFNQSIEGLENVSWGEAFKNAWDNGTNANHNGFINYYEANGYWQTVGKDFADNYQAFSKAKNIFAKALTFSVGNTRSIMDAAQVVGNATIDTASNILEAVEWAFPAARSAEKTVVKPSNSTNPFNTDYWNSIGQNFAENWDYTGCKSVFDYVEQTGVGIIDTVWDAAGMPVHAVADLGQSVLEGVKWVGNWLDIY